MSICVKCNRSIKPASLATHVSGEAFHPTCISCAICDRQLWGKPFKRTKNGKLVCEQACNPPAVRPSSARPPSGLKLQQSVGNQAQPSPTQITPTNQPLNLTQPLISNQSQLTSTDLSRYLNTNASPNYLNQSPTQPYALTASGYPYQNQNKICKICNQSVFNKRFITFENGDIICYDCDLRNAPRPARIRSAHLILCSVCHNTVQGTKYFTEPDGKIICENCEMNGPRCAKCRNLFLTNENRRNLNNGLQFHDSCFDCSVCNQLINTKDYYQNEDGLPMCLNCFEISKLPKCLNCGRHISGPYLMIDNKPIHHECFKCNECNTLLNNEIGYFKSARGLPICSSCNLKLNGSKCAKCFNVIEKDGVTFADKDYHQHCFKCDSCGVELVKMKKTLTDKENVRLYCEPCFVQNFAPKCTKCNQAILPQLPGTIYEGNNYHKECFLCARCKKTLANKKFFKTGNILICENCY